MVCLTCTTTNNAQLVTRQPTLQQSNNHSIDIHPKTDSEAVNLHI